LGLQSYETGIINSQPEFNVLNIDTEMQQENQRSNKLQNV
jgi:hypothetical protein